MTDPASSPHSPSTAFPEAAAELGGRVAQAEVGLPDLATPLERCDLSKCLGMCCYDGVYLSEEEAVVIERIVEVNRTELEEIVGALPNEPIVQGAWRGQYNGSKTATKPRPFSDLVPGFPEHFEDTACVFLAEDGRCGLQVLSTQHGHHPWHYKPLSCWMHPLQLMTRGGRQALRVAPPEEDPDIYPDYPGFASATWCGRRNMAGEPASVVLAEEILHLDAVGHAEVQSRLAAGEPEKG